MHAADPRLHNVLHAFLMKASRGMNKKPFEQFRRMCV